MELDAADKYLNIYIGWEIQAFSLGGLFFFFFFFFFVTLICLTCSDFFFNLKKIVKDFKILKTVPKTTENFL